MLSIGDAIRSACDDHRGRIAVDGLEGTQISYAQLWKEVESLSELLSAADIRPGDHVGILLPNSPDFIRTYIAIHRVGAVAVMMPAASRRWEIDRMIDLCDIGTLVTDTAHLASFPEAAPGGGLQRRLSPSMALVRCDSLRPVANRDASVAVLMPTSGSTGNYKAVMLTHQNILSNARAFASRISLRPEDRSLVCLPLTGAHAHTTQMLASLLSGSCLVTAAAPLFPQEILGRLKVSDATVVGFVPSLLAQLIGHASRPLATSLRWIIVSGAPLSRALTEQASTFFPGAMVVNAYGLTESGPRIAQTGPEEAGGAPCVGRPLDGVEVRIERPASAGPDDPGEILVKSSGVMRGYYKNEKETRATLVNGWLRTGDIGRIDSSGRLYVTGRKKNLILKNGLNVSPEEIEEFLCSIPGVKEAFVYPVSDSGRGEKIAAHLVMQSGFNITAEDVLCACRANLMSLKVPDAILFVQRIEKTMNGKVLRNPLAVS